MPFGDGIQIDSLASVVKLKRCRKAYTVNEQTKRRRKKHITRTNNVVLQHEERTSKLPRNNISIM